MFDDWHAVGPEADDHWKTYEKARGRTYPEALEGEAARNTFEFDKHHLDASDAAILIAPAGRSGHLELGYMLGKGRLGFILLDEDPDRWDVMYKFATAVCFGMEDLLQTLNKRLPRRVTVSPGIAWESPAKMREVLDETNCLLSQMSLNT